MMESDILFLRTLPALIHSSPMVKMNGQKRGCWIAFFIFGIPKTCL